MITRKPKLALASCAAACGLLLAVSVLFPSSRFDNLAIAWKTLVLIMSAALASAGVLLLLMRTRDQWEPLALRVRLGWITSCILAGWLLTWMIPFDPAPATTLQVEIETLGKGTPESKGSEVWVRLIADGRDARLRDVEAGPSWTAANGYLISPINSPPDKIHWNGHYSSDVYVEFFTHPWSGQAILRWAGKEQHYNLYSPTGGEIRVRLAGVVPNPHFLKLPSRTPLQYLVQACQSVTLGLLLLAGFGLASRWPSPWQSARKDEAQPSLGREVLTAALPLLLVGSILLVLFLPAILTTDSLNQWAQAASGRFDDAHPVLYAFYLWFIQQILPSPTLAAWLQLAVLALASGWLATVVRRACNAPRWTSTAGGLLLAAYPVTALSSITLWKDVPYATSVVALTAFVIGNTFLDRPSLRKWYNCLALVLLAACCMALRHNGPPVAVAAFLILLLRPGTRMRVLACLLLAASLMWGIKGPLADSVGTHRSSAAYMAYTHHLSAHLAAGQNPESAEDNAILEAVDSGASDWRYRCSVVNTTIFNDHYDIPTAVKHQDDLFRIWLGMALKRPDIELDHVLCASGMVWRYRTSGPLYLYVFGFEIGEEQNLQWVQPGLSGPPQASVLPNATNWMGKTLLKPQLGRLWRPAPFLITLCLLTVVAWRRTRDRRILLVPMLVLVHSAILMVAIIAQDARYQLPLYMVCLIVAPALALARRQPHHIPLAAGRAAG
ncbi:hypothetical protein [Stenotrophomonas maltophilia]|uniref:hypothetical protein n=1 Tax=Stenotrophomonas maltophilia TaxID=40324 RepID=UPI0007397A9A|nr:hypothetical protein [Stenotrophomonas maltophilia]CRD61502.1 conserved membrane hypothetical protein [Stenotrophomonas maltophilia]